MFRRSCGVKATSIGVSVVPNAEAQNPSERKTPTPPRFRPLDSRGAPSGWSRRTFLAEIPPRVSQTADAGRGREVDEAARCALVSMESTIKSNATVGPPIELLRYEPDSLGFSGYVHLDADDPYLIALMHDWDARLREAFQQVPRFEWGAIPKSSRFR